ncbi:hydrogenase maturation protease [Pengzhenrongella frigida]|uniref:Hydrogenase maturation protease n=1 Tax=Pengzhenrongella frigida TaxID=1259133 RepID=A0A4Q5MYE6_9MICO|nr:hydrogenase maturation protease [Cellulomonas sp. HLT2-17]RYV50822.1 hydrogenase maturation protease [Cellulomonas sp. HLT2-17]
MTDLVIGLGSPDGGDDAVGLWVARRVAALGLPGVAVIEHEDPTGLIDVWGQADLALVVDAVRSGAAPGALFVLAAGADAPPLTADAWARTGRGGTHAFGLAAAVELARALHRLPPRLVLVGVEAATVEHSTSLSATVQDALPAAVAAVVGALARQLPAQHQIPAQEVDLDVSR